MVNCDLCKSNYYSDDDPDTVCESKCRKMKTKEYTTEMIIEDCKQSKCRFFEEVDNKGIKQMTLQEGFKSCREGNFISHNSFDSKQSMHYYDGSFYYEDGACLDAHINWIESQEWAKDGWYIKYTSYQVNACILNSLHLSTNKRMLTGSSYEDCITQ